MKNLSRKWSSKTVSQQKDPVSIYTYRYYSSLAEAVNRLHQLLSPRSSILCYMRA